LIIEFGEIVVVGDSVEVAEAVPMPVAPVASVGQEISQASWVGVIGAISPECLCAPFGPAEVDFEALHGVVPFVG
jgi:hypothetical protein